MGTRTLTALAAGLILAIGAGSLGALADDPGAPYELGIATPADESTVFNDGGDVVVSVTIAPALASDDKVELLVDGVPIAPPMKSLDFPLTGITRGQHLLQARVIDATGNVSSISPATTVFMWEASRLFLNRRGRG
jgi:hypothetical protein